MATERPGQVLLLIKNFNDVSSNELFPTEKKLIARLFGILSLK
jgi:hypothetical protein